MERIILRIQWFFRWGFAEWFGQHCPVKIPMKRPVPTLFCSECGEIMKNIIAYNTGDGWAFFWQCDKGCSEDEGEIYGWYPFMFGAWCKGKDLARIGIMEV